ncbi:unnamed protein product, partial [Mesorhabditis spiculigera]
MARDADDYFAEDTSKLPFLHVWSLAVEMQFYLVAPLLFILGKIEIRGRSINKPIVIVAFALALFYSIQATEIAAFYEP